MKKIILFYKYVTIPKPSATVAWQKKICAELKLKGRIIIAQEGINGTLEGDIAMVDRYVAIMREHPSFTDVDFKESTQESGHFPRLRVVAKEEIVRMGIDPRTLTAENAGVHLEPHEVHELIANKPTDLIILDARNEFEFEIGRFEGAIKAPLAHFRDFPAYIESHKEVFKDKQVLMYCTGGVRCERASAYLKSKGVAQEVFQLKGGIHRYIEQFPNGFFKGKNYVFDGRTAVKVTDDILGTCFICKTACDEYTNCLRAACNRHFISCPVCLTTYKNTCSTECFTITSHDKTKLRPMPKKVYDGHDTISCAQ
jgi:predicted sulfurtransferase